MPMIQSGYYNSVTKKTVPVMETVCSRINEILLFAQDDMSVLSVFEFEVFYPYGITFLEALLL